MIADQVLKRMQKEASEHLNPKIKGLIEYKIENFKYRKMNFFLCQNSI